jgi:hypothetical protein
MWSFRRLPLRNLNLTNTAFFLFTAILMCSFAAAEQKPRPSDTSVLGESQRFFDLKIPEGFNAEATDEPGILKWRKDGGEIYLAVGESMSDSPEKFFDAIRKAAEKNKRFDEVKVLRLKGGRGLLCKEKAPDDPGRARSWRILVVANKKTLILDFTATAKEFSSFIPAFEEAVKSLKLKSPS